MCQPTNRPTNQPTRNRPTRPTHQLCEKTSATSFDEAWAATVGEKSQWVLTSSIAACTGLACLAYSMIIGDCISALAASFGATGLLAERTTAILGVTGLVVLPLCCLKSLAALSYTSLLGVMGVIFTTIVMGIRKFDGSYLPSGRFFEVRLATSSIAPRVATSAVSSRQCHP